MIANGGWLAVDGRTGPGMSALLNLPGGLDRPAEGTAGPGGTDLGALPDTQLTRLRRLHHNAINNLLFPQPVEVIRDNGPLSLIGRF